MPGQPQSLRTLRHEQIVDAAVTIISEQGIENLSLSEVEARTGLARGQLGYYFGSKESILRACLDRLARMLRQRVIPTQSVEGKPTSARQTVNRILELMLRRPVSLEFHNLYYTFLAQAMVREDYRQRFAAIHEEWRASLIEGLTSDLGDSGRTLPASPRTVAAFLQAMLLGIAEQVAIDYEALPHDELLDCCRDILGDCLGLKAIPPSSGRSTQGKKARKPRRAVRDRIPEVEP